MKNIIIKDDGELVKSTTKSVTKEAPNKRLRAFTLIELLVVITIIGILASISYAGYQGIIKTAKKARARAMCADIVTALKSYRLDYGRYPNITTTSVGDGTGNDYRWDTGDSNFVQTMLGQNVTISNTDLNPRQAVYMEVNPAEDATSEGLWGTGSSQVINDAWGGNYYVQVDANYNSMMKEPNLSSQTPSNGTTDIYQGAIAWSMGETSSPDWSESDTVKSWK